LARAEVFFILAVFIKDAGMPLLDRKNGKISKVCIGARSMSEAGRMLFSVSRTSRKTVNDADRLKKYLARFSLDWPIVSKRNRGLPE
jgi:sigma54-dependent transcription regulator